MSEAEVQVWLSLDKHVDRVNLSAGHGSRGLRDYILVLCSHCCSLSSYSEDFQKLDEVTELADEFTNGNMAKQPNRLMSALFHFTTWMLPIMHAKLFEFLKYFCCFP